MTPTCAGRNAQGAKYGKLNSSLKAGRPVKEKFERNRVNIMSLAGDRWMVLGGLYNEMKSDTFEHRHFIANDGENRGFFQDGPHSDSSEGMGKYEYMDDKKYDAAIIEEAIEKVEKRRAEAQEAAKERYNKSLELAEKFPEYEGGRLLPRETFEESVDNDYSLIGLNCQSYVNLVIKEAENIAKEKIKAYLLNSNF